MPHARRRLGDRGEDMAAAFLADRGYRMIAENYRCAAGEVDIVCRDGDTVAFVEVKTRRGTAFGAPEEAVTPNKIAHIAAVAHDFLTRHELADQPWRIDVVAIQLDATGRLEEIRLVRGAGEW